jgi:hypothetical protein
MGAITEMNFELKTRQNGTLIFSGRQKINSKDCQIEIVEHSDDHLIIKVKLNLATVVVKEDQELIIEAVYTGGYYDRKSIYDPREINEIRFSGFPRGASVKYRAFIVDKSPQKLGEIVSSTRKRLKAVNDKSNRTKKTILDWELSDEIGSEIFRISWNDIQNPEILFNLNLSQFLQDPEHPIIGGLVVPSIIREMLTGIFMEFDSYSSIDGGSFAQNWVKFFDENIVHWSIPNDNDWKDKVFMREQVDILVREFVNTKWLGTKTLLENYIDN